MDFPKDRDFPRDFAGRRAAWAIEGEGLWLKKHRFGATGWNRGGKLEVKSGIPWEAVAIAGYISYGRVLTDSFIHAISALHAEGPFLDRGSFVLTTGFRPFSALNLDYYAKGYGETITSTSVRPSGTYDFNSHRPQESTVTSHITWDGSKFTERYKFPIVAPWVGGPAYDIYTNFYEGAINDGRETAMSHSTVYLDSDHQYKNFILLDDGTGAKPRYGATVSLPYQLNCNFEVHRMSPRNLVGLASNFRPEYEQWHAENPISMLPEDCPGFVFQYSSDNGENWTRGDMGDWFQEFTDTIAALRPNLPDELVPVGEYRTAVRNSAIFNKAVYNTTFTVAPLSPTKGVIFGTVPYLVVTSGDPLYPDVWEWKAKLKVGTIDLNGNVSNASVLFDGEMVLAGAQNGGSIAVKGGVVLKRLTPDGGTTFIFTPDGASLQHGPDVYPAWLMGSLNSFAVGQLDMVFFDGVYSLYRSTDHGVTWVRQSTVTTNGQHPESTAQANYLVNYNIVTYLREGGNPAGHSPGAPWITNSRVKPP